LQDEVPAGQIRLRRSGCGGPGHDLAHTAVLPHGHHGIHPAAEGGLPDAGVYAAVAAALAVVGLEADGGVKVVLVPRGDLAERSLVAVSELGANPEGLVPDQSFGTASAMV
jgi:hypothetical protein